MARKKLAELVDRGFVLKTQLKPMNDEMDEIKKTLKAHGKRFKQPIIEGIKADAKFGIQPYPGADVKEVYDAFCDLDREEEFFDVVSVQLTALKAALGTSQADELITIKRDPFGRINFRKK
jgi:hypothetical protein